MNERESEGNSIHEADIHICIFPHLDEFIVLDVKEMANPSFKVVPASDMLTEDYYRAIEQEFSKMLRSGEGQPFMNLMALPQRLELHLRQKGMRALAHVINDGEQDAEEQRMSLFLCAGPILNMTEDDLATALETFFQGGPSQSFIHDYGSTFRRLLDQERSRIKSRQQEELRRAVQGRSNQFFTLWQKPQGPQVN